MKIFHAVFSFWWGILFYIPLGCIPLAQNYLYNSTTAEYLKTQPDDINEMNFLTHAKFYDKFHEFEQEYSINEITGAFGATRCASNEENFVIAHFDHSSYP